jgi:hypothetical protein
VIWASLNLTTNLDLRVCVLLRVTPSLTPDFTLLDFDGDKKIDLFCLSSPEGDNLVTPYLFLQQTLDNGLSTFVNESAMLDDFHAWCEGHSFDCRGVVLLSHGTSEFTGAMYVVVIR